MEASERQRQVREVVSRFFVADSSDTESILELMPKRQVDEVIDIALETRNPREAAGEIRLPPSGAAALNYFDWLMVIAAVAQIASLALDIWEASKEKATAERIDKLPQSFYLKEGRTAVLVIVLNNYFDEIESQKTQDELKK